MIIKVTPEAEKLNQEKVELSFLGTSHDRDVWITELTEQVYISKRTANYGDVFWVLLRG